MASSVTSRLPAEIWHEIIRNVIHGLDLFRPDPYDAPPPIQMRSFHHRFECQYQELRSTIFNIRAVSQSWNQFGRSLENELVGRHTKTGTDQPSEEEMKIVTKRFARALRIDSELPGPPCYCRHYSQCCNCMVWRSTRFHYAPRTLQEALEAEGVLSASILGRNAINDVELEALFSPHHLAPNLQALDLRLTHTLTPHSALLDAISTNFTSLVYLGLSILRPDYDVEGKLLLDLPQLRSLRIESEFFENFTMKNCKLPQLTCLDVSMSDLDIDHLIGRVQHVGGRLTYLKLGGEGIDMVTGGIGYDLDQVAQIWTCFPQLVTLACPLQVFIACPPPPYHPLRYFKFTDYDQYCAEDVNELPGLITHWPNCCGVAGAFPWNSVYKQLSNEGPAEAYARILLRIGTKLNAMGVAFEDEDGVDFVDGEKKSQEVVVNREKLWERDSPKRRAVKMARRTRIATSLLPDWRI